MNHVLHLLNYLSIYLVLHLRNNYAGGSLETFNCYSCYKNEVSVETNNATLAALIKERFGDIPNQHYSDCYDNTGKFRPELASRTECAQTEDADAFCAVGGGVMKFTYSGVPVIVGGLPARYCLEVPYQHHNMTSGCVDSLNPYELHLMLSGTGITDFQYKGSTCYCKGDLCNEASTIETFNCYSCYKNEVSVETDNATLAALIKERFGDIPNQHYAGCYDNTGKFRPDLASRTECARTVDSDAYCAVGGGVMKFTFSGVPVTVGGLPARYCLEVPYEHHHMTAGCVDTFNPYELHLMQSGTGITDFQYDGSICYCKGDLCNDKQITSTSGSQSYLLNHFNVHTRFMFLVTLLFCKI